MVDRYPNLFCEHRRKGGAVCLHIKRVYSILANNLKNHISELCKYEHTCTIEGGSAVIMGGGVLVKPSKPACVLCARIMLKRDSKINDDYVMVERPEAGKICHATSRTA